jgi:hypothetical protein
MTDAELREDIAVRRALASMFMQCGMRPMPDADRVILEKLQALGVTCDLSAGYLVLRQAETEIVPSGMCERIRRELPLLFLPDPKRDTVSCREDLERGTVVEIARGKSSYIAQFGLARWAALPKTKADAERINAPTTPDMTRAQYLSLPRSERVRLSGVFDHATLATIMARKGWSS